MKVRVTSEATPSPARGVSQDDVRFPVPGFYQSSAVATPTGSATPIGLATPTGSSPARTVTSCSVKTALSTVGGRTGRRAMTAAPASARLAQSGLHVAEGWESVRTQVSHHVCAGRNTLRQPCWTR